MSESAAVKPFVLERRDHAVVVRPQMKMMDDEQLKMLGRLTDEAAGADSGITLVVLDLARISILPSLALGQLVQIANNCKARQQGLKLAALQPQIRQVFTITHLDELFQFAETPEAALA
jgi:anti-sigma B factor antagonist